MKNKQLCSLLFGLFMMINFLQGQSIELVFDSLYKERFADIFSGNDIPDITTNAIYYDELDRPILYRNTFFQAGNEVGSISVSNTTYEQDSSYTVQSNYSYDDSAFIVRSRTHRYPIGENREIVLIEIFVDNIWIPSRRNEYLYNENGDFIQLDYFIWEDDEFIYVGKQVNEYTESFIRTNRYWTQIDETNNEFINRQNKWLLDSDENIINNQTWEFEEDTLVLKSNNDFMYENQRLKEALISYYTPTDTFQSRNVYTYLTEGRYDGFVYRKNADNEWPLESKTSFFESSKAIGLDIDSSFVFTYDLASDSFFIVSSYFYDYQEPLPNNFVYTEYRERYFSDTDEWVLTNYEEEYYHLGSINTVVNEVKKEVPSFIVYPNPSSDLLYFDQINKEVSEISIIDVLGNVVLHSDKALNVMRVSHLVPGVYHVMFQINGEVYSTPFVKSE